MQEEIREMQLLLTRHGFKAKVDGLFGEQTHGALVDGQKSKHISINGLPT